MKNQWSVRKQEGHKSFWLYLFKPEKYKTQGYYFSVGLYFVAIYRGSKIKQIKR